MPQPQQPNTSTPPQSQTQSVDVTPGLIVMPTYGTIQAETADSWAKLQKAAAPFPKVQFQMVSGALVDKARNEAVQILLDRKELEWLWFLDGDMVFSPEIFGQMMMSKQELPWADVIGGYCNLKGRPYLPTIDRGSGRWETHDAGMGYVEVIRTGAACVLTRRHVYEQMKAPWYEVRQALRPHEALMEFDNYARQKFDGENPFTLHKDWAALYKCAQDDVRQRPTSPLYTVGEDSNFCDKARGLGFRIVVNTNIVCGHIDKRTIWPQDHTAAIRDGQNQLKRALGLMV